MRISDWSSDVCSSDLADTTARGGNQQIAVPAHRNRANAVVAQLGDFTATEGAKLLAVVAHQPFPGSEPQVAFRSLRDAVDLIVRKPVAGRPHLARIGRQRLAVDSGSRVGR